MSFPIFDASELADEDVVVFNFWPFSLAFFIKGVAGSFITVVAFTLFMLLFIVLGVTIFALPFCLITFEDSFLISLLFKFVGFAAGLVILFFGICSLLFFWPPFSVFSLGFIVGFAAF